MSDEFELKLTDEDIPKQGYEPNKATSNGGAPHDSPSGRVVRKNAGRPMLATLVPRGAMEAIARAGEVGLTKYERDSYRSNGGYSLLQCLNSALRHIAARASGEKYDADAEKYVGRPVDHLDLAIWNLSTACENLRVYGDEVDDTWRGPNGDWTPYKRESKE